MKRFGCIVLAFTLVMALTACAAPAPEAPAQPAAPAQNSTAATPAPTPAPTPDAEAKTLKIGVAYQDFQNEFTTVIQEGVQAKAKELGNIELVEVDGQGLAENQISQVENFITQGVDGIILNPYDADGCAPAVTAAVEANIPIVVVNARTSNVDLATAFVGSDDVEAGEMEMKFIAEKLGGKGTIAVLSGLYGNSAQIDRQAGIDKVLAGYPDIKVYAEQTGNWVRDEGMRIMENWLQSGTHIDAVVAHNDQMSLGALEAIKAANLDYSVLTIGIDAIDDAINSVAAQGQSATVLQDGLGQGGSALETLAKAIKGESFEKEILIPFVLITPENVAEYQK